jgi:rare lipoprotein A
MRLQDRQRLALYAPLLLAGTAIGGLGPASVSAFAQTGPADDYPVVLGDPFTIDGITYTPEDVMNFDVVGQAIADPAIGAGVAAGHKTLPLPSYVEVTNLETGRTIIVRIVSRGPMRSDALIAISPDAALQLGFASDGMSAVRVRRVNPPEVERAMLRTGEPVPPRMDTPAPLLAALKRKLAKEAGGQAVPMSPKPVLPGADAVTPRVASAPDSPPVAMAPAPTVKAPHRSGTFVQIGAFSSEANANKAAASVGAQVSMSGKFWVVRLGPLSGKAQTDAALAKARAAGYGDAMVKRTD